LIPCSHGLRVLTVHLKVDPIVYIDEMYYSSTYQKMCDVSKDGNAQIITLDDLYEMTSQLNLGNFLHLYHQSLNRFGEGNGKTESNHKLFRQIQRRK
jgi:hypothetical protein